METVWATAVSKAGIRIAGAFRISSGQHFTTPTTHSALPLLSVAPTVPGFTEVVYTNVTHHMPTEPYTGRPHLIHALVSESRLYECLKGQTGVYYWLENVKF